VLTESTHWRRQRCLKIAQIENRLKEEQQAYDEAAEGIEKLRVRIAVFVENSSIACQCRHTFGSMLLAVCHFTIIVTRNRHGRASNVLHEG